MKLSTLGITGFFCFQLIACTAWASPKTSENLSVTVHSGSSETRVEAVAAGDPAATGNAGEGGDVHVNFNLELPHVSRNNKKDPFYHRVSPVSLSDTPAPEHMPRGESFVK